MIHGIYLSKVTCQTSRASRQVNAVMKCKSVDFLNRVYSWEYYTYIYFFFFFFFHWHYSPLWDLACRTMSFHFFLSATNSLHVLIPSTWRSLSTSSFHLSLGLPLLLVSSSSWMRIFLGILSYSILPRWPKQLILCPFIHFTIFYPLLISSSSRFAWLLHSPFSYLGPYIILNIFLSKISRACSSFFANVHACAPYDTTCLYIQCNNNNNNNILYLAYKFGNLY